MTNIGETLRAAREEQALSLDDVVAVTRIRAHFLEALEENNFEALVVRFMFGAFCVTMPPF